MARTFPIMVGMNYELPKAIEDVRKHGSHFLVCSVPWAMIEPHEKQAQSNHGQTLERLASRGGLSACESVAILEDRRWRKMEFANAILAAKITLWIDAQIAELNAEAAP